VATLSVKNSTLCMCHFETLLWIDNKSPIFTVQGVYDDIFMGLLREGKKLE